MHDKKKGSFVRYDSELKLDSKTIALGINVAGDKESIKSGSWVYVHALMGRGTQGADADLDVVSMREISKPDPKNPAIVIAEGTSDYRCEGVVGRWILMRVGTEEETFWTLA